MSENVVGCVHVTVGVYRDQRKSGNLDPSQHCMPIQCRRQRVGRCAELLRRRLPKITSPGNWQPSRARVQSPMGFETLGSLAKSWCTSLCSTSTCKYVQECWRGFHGRQSRSCHSRRIALLLPIRDIITVRGKRRWQGCQHMLDVR